MPCPYKNSHLNIAQLKNILKYDYILKIVDTYLYNVKLLYPPSTAKKPIKKTIKRNSYNFKNTILPKITMPKHENLLHVIMYFL